MNNTLSLYDFCNNDVRVVEIDGMNWFVAQDVCSALNLVDLRRALLDSCEAANWMHVPHSDVNKGSLSFAEDGMMCVNEAGLYELLLTSSTPKAMGFKRWLASVVLPALRKDDLYISGEERFYSGEVEEKELAEFVHSAIEKWANNNKPSTGRAKARTSLMH